ncbi:substrate-binding periplasmic protein [Roseateles sp.]|uniref:substrate-binding periplasmic protein n=1 Tax=Roseateles sp. TaxID=1971397 RepID=UPI003D099627
MLVLRPSWPATLLALCLLWAGAGAAAQTSTPGSTAAPLRVLINDVAPYTLRGEAQRPGMHIEIMNALAQQAELAVSLNSAVYVRLAMGLKDGSADLVVGVEGPELDALAQRVAPFHSFKFVVLTRKAAGISQVSQLRGRLLGVARGAFYDDSINKDEAIQKFPMADPFQGVRMLAVDRLDAVISSDYLLSYALRQTGIDPQAFAPPFVVNEKNYSLYARRDLPEDQVRALRRAMEHLHKSGRLATILKLYQ